MKIQYIEESGKKTFAVLPIAELDRLLKLAENAEDMRAVIESENEESFPQELVEKLVNSNSPLSVWREYRGMTQKDLASSSGVSQAYIAQIEKGKKKGGVDTLKSLAVALNVDIEDLVG